MCLTKYKTVRRIKTLNDDFEVVHGHLCYKNIPLERAELKELSEWLVYRHKRTNKFYEI